MLGFTAEESECFFKSLPRFEKEGRAHLVPCSIQVLPLYVVVLENETELNYLMVVAIRWTSNQRNGVVRGSGFAFVHSLKHAGRRKEAQAVHINTSICAVSALLPFFG